MSNPATGSPGWPTMVPVRCPAELVPVAVTPGSPSWLAKM
jgi:hypothetical protein